MKDKNLSAERGSETERSSCVHSRRIENDIETMIAALLQGRYLVNLIGQRERRGRQELERKMEIVCEIQPIPKKQ